MRSYEGTFRLTTDWPSIALLHFTSDDRDGLSWRPHTRFEFTKEEKTTMNKLAVTLGAAAAFAGAALMTTT
ncbi:MAG: hypothetical protein ACRD22_20240, partial [Terriglobia bacterium]